MPMPIVSEAPRFTLSTPFEQELYGLHLASLGSLPSGLTLLFDQPFGRALETLTTASPLQRIQLLVVSHSQSPEYIEDVWALKPGLLVTNLQSISELAQLVRQVLQQGPLRQTPGLLSRLTVSERLLLQGVSHGHSNKAIANTLGLSDRTVHNTLTRIFQKLGVASRLEATLQYWGFSEQRWRPQAQKEQGQ